jgi:hypothetical protein
MYYAAFQRALLFALRCKKQLYKKTTSYHSDLMVARSASDINMSIFVP